MGMDEVDIFVIGGGINGCGIARDAAGRGLRVELAEMKDLAWATSSASTKLFHGGLRYLEYFEFRLVREALMERETLLRAMPHISWPMRFVLPFHKDMRFEAETPTSRLLSVIMPWMRGRRPGWLIRLGLFMYDHLGGRKILPATRTLDLATAPEGTPLQARFRKAYEYSDCWVEDSRLVALNARDAAERGARIRTRTKVTRADRHEDHWVVHLEDEDGARQVKARVLVNAGGPWAEEVIGRAAGLNSTEHVRLVRGSHIVTRKLYEHDKCYFFQGTDGRIIFAIPYQEDFTLIGTTDAAHEDVGTPPVATDEEQAYLLRFASDYFKVPLNKDDIVWTYSGVRPLYDDGASSATAATRDYVLKLRSDGGAPMLNIFGGKITTYRRLAEAALGKIGTILEIGKGPWTAGVPLPGGDFPVDGVDALMSEAQAAYPFFEARQVRRLVRAYGRDVFEMLGNAKAQADLGEDFGAGLSEVELRWLKEREFARTGDDVLWRRSKLGLHLSKAEAQKVSAWMQVE